MKRSIVSGETFSERQAAGAYPAGEGWVATLYLSPRAGGTVISITGTADGDDHVLAASAATTAAWPAGWYGWETWVASGDEQYRLAAGQIEVRASLVAASTGGDTRTDAEKALADARAAFAAFSPTVKFYMIGGRQMTFNTAAEIITQIRYWETVVRREGHAAALAAGMPTDRKVFVRMGRA